jgi:transcriptional regulator with XRE-family HTH domain
VILPVEDINVDLALKIKLFRVAAGLKQQDVAEALLVTTNFVSMIERGKREPTLKYLKAFSRLVKIPLAVLLWEPPQDDSQDVANGDLYARLSALMAQYANSIGVRRVRSA